MFDCQWKNWLEEIIANVEAGEFKTEPFPYFYTEPFLPAEVYENLERFWPEDKCFWGQNDIAEMPFQHEKANLRKVVIIDDAPGFAEQDDSSEFWLNFREVLRGPELLEAILAKSLDYILEIRKDMDFSTAQCWSNALLEVDTEGFQLGPHVDATSSLLSLLLYLPHDGSPENQGTCVFQPSDDFLSKNPSFLDDFNTKYYDYEDFDEHFRAPYRKNGLFGMINGPKSYHGVAKLDQLEFGRRHILWSITNENTNPFPSALERVKQGLTVGSERTRKRMEALMANK